MSAAPVPEVEGFDDHRFARLVADGMLRAKQSSDGALWLYDYTPRAQFSSTWTTETLTCRGLVCDTTGAVVARPLPKFFNLDELDEVPSGSHRVFEKLDGSLGIVRVGAGGDLAVSTRGAFDSAQAVWATEWLGRHAGSWRPPEGVTLCVEIIYPDNRIVVDYGARAELVALAAISNDTGCDVELPGDWPGEVVGEVDAGSGDLAALAASARESALGGAEAEGWVVRFDSGVRAKVKFPAYVEIHRLLSGLTARTVWELLAGGHGIDSLVEVAPDEVHAWLAETAAGITERVGAIDAAVCAAAQAAPRGVPRADLARWVQANTEWPGLVFSRIDDKHNSERYRKALWGLVRPGADERPSAGPDS